MLGLLDERRDEAAVDDVDPAVGAGEVVVGDEAGEGQHVGEGRPVAEPREMRLDRHPRPAHRVATLAPDRDHGEVALVARRSRARRSGSCSC